LAHFQIRVQKYPYPPVYSDIHSWIALMDKKVSSQTSLTQSTMFHVSRILQLRFILSNRV
jgi:hypothetical protein